MHHIDPPLKEEGNMEVLRENLASLLISLKENTNHSYLTLLPRDWGGKSNFLLEYYNYLEMIGLLRYNYFPEMGVEITSLGKVVFKFLSGDEEDNYGKVISLLEYKESR